jgi:hypothetical protein
MHAGHNNDRDTSGQPLSRAYHAQQQSPKKGLGKQDRKIDMHHGSLWEFNGADEARRLAAVTRGK